MVAKEYAHAYQLLAINKQDPPSDDIFLNYRRFREWWNVFIKDPESNEDPYKKYNHGFRVK